MKTLLTVVTALGLTSWMMAADQTSPTGCRAPVMKPVPGCADAPKPGPDGWIQLFNGKDLTGWQDGKGKPATKWKVEDGMLVWQKHCGDIWTVARYCDYILDVEFKIEKDTNSGVFQRCDKLSDWLNTCFEIQILDTPAATEVGKHDCGSLYDGQGPSRQMLKPKGEWNRYVITFVGNKLDLVFNGVKVIDVDLDRWTEAGKNPDGTKSKFKIAWAKMAKCGFIGLQDHTGYVAFRNIKLKPLGKAAEESHGAAGPAK